MYVSLCSRIYLPFYPAHASFHSFRHKILHNLSEEILCPVFIVLVVFWSSVIVVSCDVCLETAWLGWETSFRMFYCSQGHLCTTPISPWLSLAWTAAMTAFTTPQTVKDWITAPPWPPESARAHFTLQRCFTVHAVPSPCHWAPRLFALSLARQVDVEGATNWPCWWNQGMKNESLA